jgi:hypothetical protein
LDEIPEFALDVIVDVLDEFLHGFGAVFFLDQPAVVDHPRDVVPFWLLAFEIHEAVGFRVAFAGLANAGLDMNVGLGHVCLQFIRPRLSLGPLCLHSSPIRGACRKGNNKSHWSSTKKRLTTKCANYAKVLDERTAAGFAFSRLSRIS